jgi:hypothetical protein
MAGTMASQIARTVLGRGSIFHAHSEVVGDGKWIVVLNRDWPPMDGIAIYAFFTKQVERFKRTKIPETAYLLLEPHEYDFLTVPTIVDLTDIRPRPVQQILDAKMFRYCGPMKDEHLARIEEIVGAPSLYVSKKHIKLIVG